MSVRDFKREMFAAYLASFKRTGAHVMVTVNNVVFRCIPGVFSGAHGENMVILKKGNSRKQFWAMPHSEWVQWATENGQ